MSDITQTIVGGLCVLLVSFAGAVITQRSQ